MYVACRELNGELKASMHERGFCHVAFTPAFFEAEVVARIDRRVQTWTRPPPIGGGVIRAYCIVIPSGSATVPIDGSQCTGVSWIYEPAAGRAIEVNVLMSPTATPGGDDWPSRRSMGTSLLGRFDLDDGTTVWVVWRETDAPAANTPAGGSGGYFRSKGPDDLKGGDVRAIVFGSLNDSTPAMLDIRIEVRETGASHGNRF